MLAPKVSCDAQLQALLCICEEMLQLAERGEWDRVSDLEEHRTGLLTEYFGSAARRDKALVDTAIKRMMSFNDELVRLASVARDDVSKQVQRVQHGRRVLNTYENAAI